MPPEPFVSALMPAYNAGPYIAEAIESALAVDWPGDRLEIIVVDDGSTDDTAEVAARYPVRLIRQENGGPCAAVNTALAAARGEWLALLDADDAWPVSKLRVQGEVLASRPEVGLVYGDMRVIDEAGEVLQESWLENEPLIPQGRCMAEILAGNCATASSVLMRASAAAPIPAEIGYTDWWFAASIAREHEIAYVPEPRTPYRFHGGNITLGVQGANAAREMRKAIALVRYFLARMPDGGPSARGLAAAWNYYEHCARELGEPLPSGGEKNTGEGDEPSRAGGESAARAGGEAAASPAVAGVPPGGGSRVGGDAAASPAVAGVPPGGGSRMGGETVPAEGGALAAAARAAAADPGRGAPALRDAIAAELGREGHRVVLAFAGELLVGGMEPWLEHMADVPGVTLAVVTPPDANEALGAIVPDELDVVAILSPVQLETVHALFSEVPRTDPAVPRFDAGALPRLAAAFAR